MEKNSFTIIDDKGVERSYDVLFTFDNDETKKSYIVYTDNTTDSTGNVEVPLVLLYALFTAASNLLLSTVIFKVTLLPSFFTNSAFISLFLLYCYVIIYIA